jgi:hypothetical protein
MTGGWQKFHNEEIHYLFSSQVKEDGICSKHELGEKKNTCNILVRNPEGERLHGRPSHSGRIILKWVLMVPTELIWIMIGAMGWGSCEHGSELLGSIKMLGIY